MPTPAVKLARLNKDVLKLFQLNYYERSSYLQGIEPQVLCLHNNVDISICQIHLNFNIF